MKKILLTHKNSKKLCYGPDFFEILQSPNGKKRDLNIQSMYDFINIFNLEIMNKILNLIIKNSLKILVSDELILVSNNLKDKLSKLGIECEVCGLSANKESDNVKNKVVIISYVLADINLANKYLKEFSNRSVALIRVQRDMSIHSKKKVGIFDLYTLSNRMNFERPSVDLEIKNFEVLMNCLYLNIYAKSIV